MTICPNGKPLIERRFDRAIQRFDIEEGFFFVAKENFVLYAGAGPYYLRDSTAVDKSSWGGMGHLKMNIMRYLSLDFFVSNDSFFKTKYQGQISLSLPNFSPTKDRLFPVFRQEIIPVNRTNEWEWNF